MPFTRYTKEKTNPVLENITDFVAISKKAQRKWHFIVFNGQV